QRSQRSNDDVWQADCGFLFHSGTPTKPIPVLTQSQRSRHKGLEEHGVFEIFRKIAAEISARSIELVDFILIESELVNSTKSQCEPQEDDRDERCSAMRLEELCKSVHCCCH